MSNKDLCIFYNMQLKFKSNLLIIYIPWIWLKSYLEMFDFHRSDSVICGHFFRFKNNLNISIGFWLFHSFGPILVAFSLKNKNKNILFKTPLNNLNDLLNILNFDQVNLETDQQKSQQSNFCRISKSQITPDFFFHPEYR